MYKFPIEIQAKIINEDEIGNQLESWITILKCRAEINCIGGKEYYLACQQNSQNDMKFKIRYCKALKKLNSQLSRIIYNNEIYDIKHIDDFEERHETLKIKAVKKNV
ncbi:MAG: phage head closure protein [Oscillospiraceae bacterium]